ncbi:phosphoribosyltransferase [aff. Roholtiella sp. LEGE 12411]|uniref:phosphoribosyltransferase n=1 Tax=aff. Roholtiella sp. LEGE 12411 TaxID=1828822 RepID=UPI00187EE224|nr:phosphoribosyltransferase [aff. Roholtiella sp. LEGE 12411]MBE9034317.1 phosphoribosyltransferase [aff. Roholtiella sp. LEGE 12411]
MLFQDRRLAGEFLAGELAAYANRPDVVVLGLPRGGVPVAFEVCQALNAPLDVLVVRKLGVPEQEELAMGAIASGGVQILNEYIVNEVKISDEVIARIAVQEQRELERRERLYRGDKPDVNLWGRTVILVDDGLATGATMWAAIVAVRKQQPAKIVVAVPVAALETCQVLEAEVDEMVYIATPSPFYSVSLWYDNFPQTTDEEVRNLLTKATNNYQLLSSGK